ncbi:MAG: chemotaxis protein [Hyphomicrobiales bacterium]|nr:MAG: chemotaxis protein [Hyphomicrobiales bacterium]
MLSVDGAERKLGQNDLIVSKTNLKGHITYANDVFLDIADYSLKQVLNQPHSMIRSEAMPRCVFQLLWEYLQDGREIFAYVVNATRKNDHYWVFAHVTPSTDANGKIISYHSNRRAPSEAAIEAVKALYEILLAEEAKHSNRKEGQKAGYALLLKILEEKGMSYDEFIFSL